MNEVCFCPLVLIMIRLAKKYGNIENLEWHILWTSQLGVGVQIDSAKYPFMPEYIMQHCVYLDVSSCRISPSLIKQAALHKKLETICLPVSFFPKYVTQTLSLSKTLVNISYENKKNMLGTKQEFRKLLKYSEKTNQIPMLTKTEEIYLFSYQDNLVHLSFRHILQDKIIEVLHAFSKKIRGVTFSDTINLDALLTIVSLPNLISLDLPISMLYDKQLKLFTILPHLNCIKLFRSF
jgi:hypothetical protein